MLQRQMFLVAAIICTIAVSAQTIFYSYEQCQGSLRPYPESVEPSSIPDTLKVVMINHVGRHGARYPASSTHCMQLQKALRKACEAGTITPLGEQLLSLTDSVINLSRGRWGELDSLGMAEQRHIATQMFKTFKIKPSSKIHAISSYSPRVMMSMYSFTHQLDILNNKYSFVTETGHSTSPLMRPFDVNEKYKEFYKGKKVMDVYGRYFDSVCPTTAIDRVMGEGYAYESNEERKNLAITEYYVLSGMSAMSVECDLSKFFTLSEINALWSCFNLRQYLQRTASKISTIPADIATDLLQNLVDTFDKFISSQSEYQIYLRFGHAETLMPLFSLMRLPGCYYLTDNYSQVAEHWCDFHVVPMAANIMMILCETDNGKLYLRVDHNGKTTTLIPGDSRKYLPWEEARKYLMDILKESSQKD